MSPNFDGHIDPDASSRYFDAHGLFPPTVSVNDSPRGLEDRIASLRRVAETQRIDHIDSNIYQLTHEIGFLEDRIRQIGNTTLKG